ncbi:hypothetical protein FDP25_14400 [Roseovarius sp. A21]|uniref:Uncharacterized protein n=1 Tax=Roseovarius bejariae TaxID=2576383 RepID=A0A844CX01_9RHOB|nr:hypothetical protein [Roseovarius bejariae]MRU16629.1 hypothetical protein [Roseovarius bejariae]
MKLKALALALSMFPLAGMAQAELYEDMPPLCLGHVVPADLTGDYTFSTGSLALRVNGQPMSPDKGGEVPAVLTTNADAPSDLLLTGLPELPAIHLTQTMANDGKDWDLSRAPDFELANPELELVLACDLEDLPALSAQFRTQSQDGYDIDNTFRLVVLEAGWLIGLWEFTAIGTPYPISGLRSIALER